MSATAQTLIVHVKILGDGPTKQDRLAIIQAIHDGTNPDVVAVTSTEWEKDMTKPQIGHLVTYRTDGRNGLVYDLPAIVTCTKDSHPGDYPDGKNNPLPVPESDLHVHLTVFTPGGFGTHILREQEDGNQFLIGEDPADFKGAEGFVPGSGTYVEWNVPFDGIIGDDPDSTEIAARSWRWK